MIKYLLLDFDGTLVEQQSLLKFKYFLNCLKFPQSNLPAYKIALAAFWIQKAMKASDGKESIYDLSSRIFRETTTHPDIIYQKLHDFCLNLLTYKPMTGALDFVSWASQSFKLILATNPIFSFRQLCFRLMAAGFKPKQFHFITSSEEMRYIKPRPEYFQEIIRILGAKPHECLMIGNDRKKDRAENAKIPTLILGSLKVEAREQFKHIKERLSGVYFGKIDCDNWT